MKHCFLTIPAGIFLLAAAAGCASMKPTVDASTTVTIIANRNDEGASQFTFKTVPPPSASDAATAAKFTIVDGVIDPNSGGVEKLHDGRLPDEADQPDENFFFQVETGGGRLQVDLGKPVNIRQINTYSWHPGSRGPQIYKLYASEGTAKNFNATPKNGTAPEQCGWKFIGAVDTKPESGETGGQYGVSISHPNGNLGNYRYLLFEIAATESDDAFGNTFYSEIDVIDADAPVTNQTAAVVAPFTFKTVDGKCIITLDTKLAPELKDWAETNLAPVLAEWYPKITALLPSDGFAAPDHFKITLKPMPGVAYTAGRNVVANSDWLKKEIGKQAVGSIVHECVHVVQQFRGNGNPGWLVEGSADYIRWFKYEPQSHGADNGYVKRTHRGAPRYNESYRVTANFLNWVAEKYDPEIVTQMNVAMREGKYDEGLWQKYTGKSASDLGAEWQQEFAAPPAAAPQTTGDSK